MVGPATHGELKAEARSSALTPRASNATASGGRSALRFSVATSHDDPAIRRLLRETPMHGAIRLGFGREPDYFAGASLAGSADETIVAYENGHLLCMGRCTTRESWVNGAVRRVGYLAELRLHPSARGRFAILRDGYRFFHELHQSAPPDVYFTSVAADNARARRLLERGAPGLPRYSFLTEFTTLLIGTKSHRAPDAAIGPASAEELALFLDESARKHHFAAHWTPGRISALRQHGLSVEDFIAFRHQGRVIGAAACWDQRPFRQTVIQGYSRPLSLFRPVYNALAPILDFPRLPSPGSVLAHAVASPLALAPEHATLLPKLVHALGRRAASRGLEFLTLGFPSSDPRVTALRRAFRCRTYRTRLYQVSWPGERPLTFDSRSFLPDVALL